jgi:hypothetical protein
LKLDLLKREALAPKLEALQSPKFLAPAVALAATVAVQGLILGSDFVDEDLRHFYGIQETGLIDSAFSPYGSHFIAAFVLAIAGMYELFGLNAFWHFAVLLLTHVLNVALLYGITRALSGNRWLAAVAAALWGASCAFHSTLQWFSAYSHILGVAAMLWALWEIARAVEARRPPTNWALLRVSVVLFAGSATELTGSLVAAVFPVVAFLMLPRESSPLKSALKLTPTAALSIAVVLIGSLAKADAPMLYFSYERTAVALIYLMLYGIGVIPAGPLVTLDVEENPKTILGNDSDGIALAISAVITVGLAAAVAWRFVRGDWAERRTLLALVGLAALLYAAVAIGRSGFTWGKTLVWLATRGRYHYDANPTLVIAVALALAKLRPSFVWPPKHVVKISLALLAGSWLVANHVVSRLTYLNGGGRHEWTRDWTNLTSASIELFAMRIPERGTLYVRNDRFKPASLMFAMGAPEVLFPGIGAHWIVYHGPEDFQGRTIRFVEENPELLRAIHERVRPEVATMFVSAEEVRRKGAKMFVLARDAPPEVATYIDQSADPVFAAHNRQLANRLLKSVRDEYSRAQRAQQEQPGPMLGTESAPLR